MRWSFIWRCFFHVSILNCSQLCLKFVFKNYEVHSQQHFQRHHKILRKWINIFWLFLGQIPWSKNRLRDLENYQLHKKPNLKLEDHCTKIEDNISLIFVRFFFSPISLIFEFNLVLIFLAQFIYLFYFLIIIWYSTGLEVHPVPPQFFLSEPVKLCWGSMFFSFESLRLQNVLIVFLFTMKPVMYLLWNECTC